MKSILSALLLGFALPLVSTSMAADTRVYEIRTYHANEGKLDALNARFRDHTVALFKKHGMENIGYWVPTDNKENVLIYVLAYPSKEARGASWKAFMSDPEWKAAQAASEKDGKLVNKVDSQFMMATDYSHAIMAKSESPARLFELRVYHTNEGKLKNLDARFRDHTMEIFEDLGMQNIAYWHLMDDQAGANSTLVYLLGFKDEAARGKAWQGFGQDPRWKKAYAESIVDGKLVNKVDSTQMKATDYSPTK
jgi:uncharacterized protein YbaA (DUF1428 family)